MRLLNITAISIGLLLSGCAITQDGTKFSTGAGPTKADVNDFLKRNNASNTSAQSTANSGQAAVKEAAKEIANSTVKSTVQESINKINGTAKIIIIGNAMSLYALSPKQVEERYAGYEKARKANNLPLAIDKDWYLSTIVGAVHVKVGGIPGIYAQVYLAELDKNTKEKIDFPSAFSTAMFGTTSDLVVAEGEGEKQLLVKGVLCSKKDDNFNECSSKYAKGLFQGIDGLEVDTSFKIKTNGQKIDTATYQKQ